MEKTVTYSRQDTISGTTTSVMTEFARLSRQANAINKRIEAKDRLRAERAIRRASKKRFR